jgi:hypothetical protein
MILVFTTIKLETDGKEENKGEFFSFKSYFFWIIGLGF